MGIEERKLLLIQRCMNIHDESELRVVEETLRNLELDLRAQLSEDDIRSGNVEDYHRFSDDIKLWLQEKRRSA